MATQRTMQVDVSLVWMHRTEIVPQLRRAAAQGD